MPRAARFVVPNVPHHILQRGNRCQRVFFSDDDKALYLRFLRKWGRKSGLTLWAYCLMDNHVHLVAVPERENSLAVGLGETHKAYTKVINAREGWRGFLWQGRFLSYAMDDRYVYRAIRYVELNPVRARIVNYPVDYPWSSARAHVLGEHDPLLSRNTLNLSGLEWSAFLKEGMTEAEINLFRDHSGKGPPMGIERIGTRT